MEPEGVTVEELQKARDTYRLRVDGMHDILRTLWAFRLLGYAPADTAGLSYADICAIVAAGTARA